MEVSVESISNLERKLTIQVPAERIDAEVDSRLKSMVGRVQLKGFRPGKVPLKVVKQRYGQGVYAEVVGEVMQSTFQEAVTQENLRPAGMPAIEPVDPKPGSALEYTAVFEVYPDIELQSLETAEISQIETEINAADVDAMIEKLREQHKEWVDVDRASQDGDQVMVDFEGFLGDEAFDGGKAENSPVELGSGRMIPGFEEQLLGVKAGDEKTLNVTFPEDYQAENLAGKEARFETKVHAVQQAKLPELGETFIAKFGVEDGDIDTFRKDIEMNMQREANQAIKSRVKNAVMDRLLELHQIDLPKALIDSEVQALRKQALQNMGQQAAGNIDENMLPDDLFTEEANKRVALGLIVGQIIRDNDIKLDQDRVDVTLDELAATYQEPEQFKQFYRSNREQMSTIEAMVIEEQVVDWVKSQAKVSTESISFEDLMDPAKAQSDEE